MATSSSKTLDHWREVFRIAGESDVFRVIRQGIRLAASNHPDEFRIRKDKIVQMLFAPLPRVEKSDEGHGDAVEAMEEEKSGRGNPVKSVGALSAARTPPSAGEPPRAAVPVAVVEEKAETKRQETWKIMSVSANGKILLRRVIDDQTKPSKPQKTFTDQHQVPDEPPVIAAEPSNQERSLPTFTEHQPPDLVIAPSTRQPQGCRSQRLASTEHKPPQPPVIVVALPAKRPRLPNMVLDDASLRSKLETSKRKLREGYQQTENVKRQRKIQVIQPREVPKDSGKRPPLFKSLGTWLR